MKTSLFIQIRPQIFLHSKDKLVNRYSNICMCLLGPRPTCNVDQIVEICNLTNAIGVQLFNKFYTEPIGSVVPLRSIFVLQM